MLEPEEGLWMQAPRLVELCASKGFHVEVTSTGLLAVFHGKVFNQTTTFLGYLEAPHVVFRDYQQEHAWKPANTDELLEALEDSAACLRAHGQRGA